MAYYPLPARLPLRNLLYTRQSQLGICIHYLTKATTCHFHLRPSATSARLGALPEIRFLNGYMWAMLPQPLRLQLATSSYAGNIVLLTIAVASLIHFDNLHPGLWLVDFAPITSEIVTPSNAI